MDFVANLLQWFADPAHWSGPGGIPARTLQHLGYSAVATLAAAAIALPLGMVLGHVGRYGNLAINVANIGRAIPTFGLILIAFMLLRFSVVPVYIALIALAIPPILVNTYVGIREVDPEVRDAAVGTGMTGSQILWGVELPVALPLIMAGLRVSAVQVVATATLAAVVSFGGLGRYIIDGLAKGVQGRARGLSEVVAGAILVAALAIATDLALGWLQRAATPKGLRAAQSTTASGPTATEPS
jgi:osmoprotectant transport system permease protein